MGIGRTCARRAASGSFDEGQRVMPVHSPDAALTATEGLDVAAFKAAMARFASGVTIVTTRDPDGVRHGFTASSFCSVSLDPPLVLVCVARSATSYPAFAACERFAVSVLRAEQTELASRFARKGEDKFGGGGFVPGGTGQPVVAGALAVAECAATSRFDAGDHVILVGRVLRADATEGTPAVYFNRNFSELQNITK